MPTPTQAQISADGTLSTTVINNDGLNFSITDGNQSGTNLFHSFSSFSLPTEGSAIFNNALEIQTIFSRVTGNSISNIDGLLQANGRANLFLLNPNGIVFGPNARLNLGGSFIGSSGDRILFADGTEFSATSPNSPTLTVNIPIGLQFRENPGTIINQSQAVNNNDRIVGLQVTQGNTLALLGGDVIFDGGFLSNNSGRIELGSVADNSLVNITSTNPGYIFGYEAVENFRDIQLFREAFVNSSGNNSNIQVRGRQIELRDGAQILMATQGSETVGTMTVIASELIEIAGEGGNIAVQMRDVQLRNNSILSTTAGTEQGQGNGGNINIDTQTLVGIENSDITANAFSGRGGGIDITSQGIFGLQRRQELTSNNDITAFSQINPQLNGEIGLNTPDVDPTSGLIALPENVVDPAALIAQNICAQRGESEFIITGRGGLPPNPGESLNPDLVNVDLVAPAPINSVAVQPLENSQILTQTVQSPVPARGWVFNQNGEVLLTAQSVDDKWENLYGKNGRSLLSNLTCQ